MKLREWNAHLHGLVVFRALLNDPVVAKLLDLTDRMEAGCSSYGPVCDAVAAFEAALFEYTTNWGSYLSNAVLEAETICVRQAAAGQLDTEAAWRRVRGLLSNNQISDARALAAALGSPLPNPLSSASGGSPGALPAEETLHEGVEIAVEDAGHVARLDT